MLDCCRRPPCCYVSRETSTRSSNAGEWPGERPPTTFAQLRPVSPRPEVIHKVIHSNIHRFLHVGPRRHPPALASAMTVRSALQEVLMLCWRKLGPGRVATRCRHVESEPLVLSPSVRGKAAFHGPVCSRGRGVWGGSKSTLTSSDCQGEELHPGTPAARRPEEDLGEPRCACGQRSKRSRSLLRPRNPWVARETQTPCRPHHWALRQDPRSWQAKGQVAEQPWPRHH